MRLNGFFDIGLPLPGTSLAFPDLTSQQNLPSPLEQQSVLGKVGRPLVLQRHASFAVVVVVHDVTQSTDPVYVLEVALQLVSRNRLPDPSGERLRASFRHLILKLQVAEKLLSHQIAGGFPPTEVVPNPQSGLTLLFPNLHCRDLSPARSDPTERGGEQLWLQAPRPKFTVVTKAAS